LQSAVGALYQFTVHVTVNKVWHLGFICQNEHKYWA